MFLKQFLKVVYFSSHTSSFALHLSRRQPPNCSLLSRHRQKLQSAASANDNPRSQLVTHTHTHTHLHQYGRIEMCTIIIIITALHAHTAVVAVFPSSLSVVGRLPTAGRPSSTTISLDRRRFMAPCETRRAERSTLAVRPADCDLGKFYATSYCVDAAKRWLRFMGAAFYGN